jgi:hypothetical protein
MMANTWVLDTETKGTGAHVVPLEKVARTGAHKPELNVVKLRRPKPPRLRREPDAPRRRVFKILDVMTRETLAESVDLRTTVDLLGEVRTITEVHVHVWDADRRRWRLLDLDEQRALWDLRRPHRLESAGAFESGSTG